MGCLQFHLFPLLQTLVFMQKNFDSWNNLKKIFEKESREVFAHPREVWWCSLGVNLGAEIDGKNDNFERPVLVLSVYSRETMFILPITGKEKSELLITARMILIKFKPENRMPMLLPTPVKEFKFPKVERAPFEDAFDEIELLSFPVSCSEYRGRWRIPADADRQSWSHRST